MITVLHYYVLFWTLVNVIVAIGSATQTTLKFEDITTSLSSEEMRLKTMDSKITNTFFFRVQPEGKNKNKSCGGIYKPKDRYKSIGKIFKQMMEM